MSLRLVLSEFNNININAAALVCPPASNISFADFPVNVVPYEKGPVLFSPPRGSGNPKYVRGRHGQSIGQCHQPLFEIRQAGAAAVDMEDVFLKKIQHMLEDKPQNLSTAPSPSSMSPQADIPSDLDVGDMQDIADWPDDFLCIKEER